MLTVLVVWLVASFVVGSFVGRAMRLGRQETARARAASRRPEHSVDGSFEVA